LICPTARGDEGVDDRIQLRADPKILELPEREKLVTDVTRGCFAPRHAVRPGDIVADWRLFVAAGLCAAIAGPVAAQQTPQPAASQDTTVVVEGKRNEVTDRIDRRVYDIKSDPDSQSGNAGDVLNKLPSVTVNPAGRVALRGDTNVTVLIDGKYPVNGNNFTQTLAASDIDRIEVITNPSAQYAADGTSGIINIITKKRHPFGISGTQTVRDSTQNQVNANGSLSLTKGPWSVTGRAGTGRYPGRYGWNSIETAPDPIISNVDGHFTSQYANGELEASRKIGDDQTVTVNGAYSPNWSTTRETEYYRSAGRAYTKIDHSIAKNLYSRAGFIYDLNDDKSGRHLTLDASLGHYGSTSRSLNIESYTVPAAGQSIYGTYDRSNGVDDDIKADYEQHPASGHVLTTGFEWKRNGAEQSDLFSDSGTIAGPHVDGSSHLFFGRRDVTALYITYQHPFFGGWTMLPGLRAEYEAMEIRSLGQMVRPDDLQLYPTLHLSHDLGKGKFKISYSRRVDRPWLGQYDPARVYLSTTFATQGNPKLKAPTTDSWELGYDYSQGKVSYDATLYYHALTNDVSTYYRDLGNGMVLQLPVNSGHARSGGSEFTVKTPVSKHWKVSLNLNLFYAQVPLLSGTTQTLRGAISYVSNSSIEYDWDKGDQLQLALGLNGRQLTAQGYNEPTSHLDLTWRHNITKKIALVLNAQDMLAGQRTVTIYNTPDLKSRSASPAYDRLVRISLTRTFGGPGK
jgi:outer membrane receptor for ferrienterochelin and colicin